METLLNVVPTGKEGVTTLVDFANGQEKIFDSKTGDVKKKTCQAKDDNFVEALWGCCLAAQAKYDIFMMHMIVLCACGAEIIGNKNGPLEVWKTACIKLATLKDRKVINYLANILVWLLDIIITYKKVSICAALVWVVYLYKPSIKVQRLTMIFSGVIIFFVAAEDYVSILIFHALYFFFSMLANNNHKIVIVVIACLYYLVPYVFPVFGPPAPPVVN